MKARIKTIKRGEFTYYQPQIQQRFIWKYWTSIAAYTHDGSTYYGSNNKYQNIHEAHNHLLAFEKLMDVKLDYPQYIGLDK